MSRAKFPHVDAAEAYARDLVSGKIPACALTIAAAKRHHSDLERAKAGGPFVFDRAAGERVCRFAELLPHVKGEWARAKAGDPTSNRIKLEQWQCFFLASIFGWKHRTTGRRRFRKSYAKIPRKNAKSTLAAIVGNYCLAADGEEGAEVYSGATSEKQAWEVFRPARQMALRTPDFLDAFGVTVNAKSLTVETNASRFEPLIGKPGDGASPSCAIVDEYHEHDDDSLSDTMLTGMGARQQPLLFWITTAGSNTGGPCYATEQECARIVRGETPAEVGDETFVLIYGYDPEVDWRSELALRQANPNFDVSVDGAFLRQQQLEAISSTRKQNTFKTKHLNAWVNAHVAWMNLEAWKRCEDTTLKIEDFAGESCFVGVDLASKLDIAAVAYVFPREVTVERDGKSATEQHYFLFVDGYLPEDRVREAAHHLYPSWVQDGWLRSTPGNVTDYDFIEADLEEAAKRHQVAELAYDPWQAQQLANRLGSKGLPIVELGANVKNYSEPMKALEALVVSGRLHHDGNPVLAWMVSNVVARIDAKENIYPRKESPEKKIDGVVAAISALARALLLQPEGPSRFEDGELSL